MNTILRRLVGFGLVMVLMISAISLAQGQQPTVPTTSMTTNNVELINAGSRLTWKPLFTYTSATLTIIYPDGTRQDYQLTTAGMSLDLNTAKQRLVDGKYEWHLSATNQPTTSRTAPDQERDGSQKATGNETRASGGFIVSNGSVAPFVEETAQQPSVPNAPNDQVIADDLIVQSSLCVGFDCAVIEDFGFDTVRLKENNLRIKFEDTSVTGGFPGTDWQLTANDSASGGADKFSIEDVTGAKVPFTLRAGAPTDSLYVNSSGKVGLGTSAPVLKLHLQQSDTPSIRLEQTNAGGWTPQTWDIGANEANFFVRDLTGGDRLTFRIRPGAPTSSLDISSSGNVGIGTPAPKEKLHVAGNVLIDGHVIELSDVNAKANFVAVDSKSILEKLATLSINTWNYKAEGDQVRHIGPTAQDFYTAFGLGNDNRHISPLDTNGIALAAIQALYQQNLAKDAEIAALKQQNQDLNDRLTRLEQAVNLLTAQEQGK